jgi:IMP dehydrogenase
MNKTKCLGYDNIGLISRNVSTLEHRSEANTSVDFAGLQLTIPIIASPMPDVCDGQFAKKIRLLGGCGIIHRFQTIEEQLKEFHYSEGFGGCAIGVVDDYLDRLDVLYDAGCRIFCLDTANGANKQVSIAINRIRDIGQEIYLIVGNVASKETFAWLVNLGVNAIRVGIAGGAACSTRLETGMFYPMVSSLLECVEYKKANSISTLIIADGGIRIPADICKALAIGADVVMLGSVLAGCEESPAKTIKINNELKKIFRGAASYSTQYDNGKKPKYVEGLEQIISYTGSLEKTMNRFQYGLQSSMSYMNARTIKEFQNNADWCILS